MTQDLIGKSVHNVSEVHTVVNMYASYKQKVDSMEDKAILCSEIQDKDLHEVLTQKNDAIEKAYPHFKKIEANKEQLY